MENFNFKETRYLHREDLKRLCIKNEWYTKGNNEEYTKLLDLCNVDKITTDIIVTMANDIALHSELSLDYTYLGHLENICYQIAKTCFSLFE